MGWWFDDWQADDPELLYCKKHDRHEPCRPCLREEGFYDPCVTCGQWRGHHIPRPLKSGVCSEFRS